MIYAIVIVIIKLNSWFSQRPYMNAKRTRIAILGRNARKENVFVKEIQQEMGNTAEVIIRRSY